MGGREPAGPVAEEPVVVGRILSSWGIKGELKVQAMTSFPEALSEGRRVFVKGIPIVIEEGRRHGKFILLKFQGVDTVEAAQRLRGEFLQIPADETSPLSEGEYYHFQIIGLEVWTTGGDFLGLVTRIIETGSNDVYLVRSGQKEVLIPAIAEVVKAIDLKKGRMEIEVIAGLL